MPEYPPDVTADARPAIARVIEHRRRRPDAAERLVVANVDPTSTGVGLPSASTGTVVVAMQPLGATHGSTGEDRRERRATDPTASVMVDSAIGTPSRA